MGDDLGRLGPLLLATIAASRGGYVLIRLGARPGGPLELRVNVRHGTGEHTSRAPAHQGAAAVTAALTRACAWLARQGAP